MILLLMLSFTLLSSMHLSRSMENRSQEVVEESLTVIPPLKLYYASKIISAIAHGKLELSAVLARLPLEVRELLINTSFNNHHDTLAHFYAQKAAYFQSKDPKKSLEWLEKLTILFSNGFNNCNSHNTIPLTHSLIKCNHETTKKTALKLIKKAIRKGACLHEIHEYKNLLEAAIRSRFFDAVKFFTEKTDATLDLTRPEFPFRSIMLEIDIYKDRDPLYEYLFKNLSVYKLRNEISILAPCCNEGGHPCYCTDPKKFSNYY